MNLAPDAATAASPIAAVAASGDVVEVPVLSQPEPAISVSPASHPEPAISASPASQPQPVISMSPGPESSEHAFWDAPPAYSMPPADLVSQRPLPNPSWARSLLTRLVFVLILCAAATLLCYEISVAYHLPWLDPRLLAARFRSG
jgi:hypothetical protein